MAKLNRDDVLKLARLARLQLTEDEVSQFTNEISAILGYIDQLQTVDVGGVEPTTQVTGLASVMRPDEEETYATPAELLKNAPATEDGHIKVRRVIE